MWNSAFASFAIAPPSIMVPSDSELDADHVLDSHDLAATHADRLGDVADVLAHARTGNLIRREPVVILGEHRVRRLLRVTGRGTHGGRGDSGRRSRLLRADDRTTHDSGNKRGNRYSHHIHLSEKQVLHSTR